MSIRRNTSYNLLGYLLPMLVVLVTVPPYLRLIGEERYAILAIGWTLLGYFGLFDLGLSRATAHHLARLDESSAEKRSEVFWSALFINLGFGILGGLILLPLGYVFFGSYFELSEGLRSETVSVVPWFAAAVPIATVSGVLSGALQGRERFLELNMINILGTLMFQVLPLGVAWLIGPSLAWLLGAALLGRLLSLVLMFGQCRVKVPLVSVHGPRRVWADSLIRYGGWVTVTGIVGPLMVTMDRLLIGAVLGARAVTYYVVPHSLTGRAAAFPQSFSAALFPRFAGATGKHQSNRLATEATIVLAVVMTPVITAGMLAIEPFLTWWLSPQFAARASNVGHILALGLWVNALASIPYAKLQGTGRPDVVAKCHLIELVPYLIFLVWALRSWGVEGAAIAWSLRVAVDALLLFWLSDLRPHLRLFTLPLTTLTLTSTVVLFLPMESTVRWLVGSIMFMLACIWGWHVAPAPLKRAFDHLWLRDAGPSGRS